jgi:hypothetical protein
VDTQVYRMHRGSLVAYLFGMALLLGGGAYFFVWPIITGYLDVEGGDVRTKIIVCGLVAAVPIGLVFGIASNLCEKWKTEIIVSDESIASGGTVIAWSEVTSFALLESEGGICIKGPDDVKIIVPKVIQHYNQLLEFIQTRSNDGRDQA